MIKMNSERFRVTGERFAKMAERFGKRGRSTTTPTGRSSQGGRSATIGERFSNIAERFRSNAERFCTSGRSTQTSSQTRRPPQPNVKRSDPREKLLTFVQVLNCVETILNIVCASVLLGRLFQRMIPAMKTYGIRTSIYVRTILPTTWFNAYSKNRRTLENWILYRKQQLKNWLLICELGKQRKLLNKCKQEAETSEEEDSLTLSKYLTSLIPSDLKDLVFVSAIVFSFTSFVIVLVKASSAGTKGLKFLLASTFMALFTTITSYMLKDNEDNISDLFSTAQPQQLLTAIVEEPRTMLQKFEDECIEGNLSRREMENKIEDESLPLLLPLMTKPIRFPYAIRPRLSEFEYSDKFLCWLWNITPNEMFSYRHIIKASTKAHCVESLSELDHLDETQQSEDLNNSETEDRDISTLTGILARLTLTMVYVGECFITKEKFSFSKLLACLRNTKELKDGGMDLVKLMNYVRGIEDPSTGRHKIMAKYVDDFNEFMKIPTYVFAKSPRKLKNGESLCKSFESFHQSLSKEEKAEAASVHGLYVSANQKIHTYCSTEIMSLSRQEPFIVCFTGKPGIGKTQMVRHMMKKLSVEHYKISPLLSTREITPEDKYWPPLEAQEIVFFDDSCSKKDLREDLLWNNVKGICSPAFFNAAGAAISSKINPINFKVIFTTTNTSFEEMASRVTAHSDAATWEAYCRRMIFIDVAWNKTSPPCNNPGDYDNVQFKHLKFRHWEYKDQKLGAGRTILYQQIYQTIVEREQRMHQEFHTHIRNYTMTGLETQSSKSHFSIVLHGRQGQGKSYVIGTVGKELALALNLRYIEYTAIDDLPSKTFKNRVCCVLDDIVTPNMSIEDEKRVMEFYNRTLADGSVLIFGTNVSPKTSWPMTSIGAIIGQRQLPFCNEGLIRRMGYTGNFKGVPMPPQNLEIFVSNMRYYHVLGDASIDFANYLKDYITELRDLTIPSLIKLFSVMIFMLMSMFIPYILVLPIFWIYLHLKNVNRIEIKQTLLGQTFFQEICKFQDQKRGFSIVDVETPPELISVPNIVIRCEDSSEFLQNCSPAEIDKHVFTDRTLFESSPLRWKIFMDKIVVRQMAKNMERFLINEVNFDEASIYSILNRYVPAFTSLNINPVFDFRFRDVGDYIYQDGTLFRLQRNMFGESEIPEIIFEQDHCLIKYTGNLIDINSFLYDLDNVLANFSYNERIILKRFHLSSEFRNHKYVSDLITRKAKADVKNMLATEVKLVADRMKQFIRTPAGILSIILIGVIAAIGLITLLVKMCSGKEKKNEKRANEWDDFLLSLLEDDDAEWFAFLDKLNDVPQTKQGRILLKQRLLREKKNKKRKGSPKTRSFDSDDDKKAKSELLNSISQKKNKKRKGSPKVRKYDSDDDKLRKEDVMTLGDMNEFNALQKYIDVARTKCRKNMCQIYTYPGTAATLSSATQCEQACYGIFIKRNMLATVGHVTDLESNSIFGKHSLYCAFDGSDGFHRLIRIQKYRTRDISVYEVPSLKQDFPDITKLFFKAEEVNEDIQLNSAFERFGLNKREEIHTGEMSFIEGPVNFDGGNLSKYATIVYGAHGVKLTEAGDCGLPYYAAELQNKYHNKVYGIHCMGNVEGYTTLGVCAMIFQEDVEEWSKKMSKQAIEPLIANDCCKIKEMTVLPASNPKCQGHKIVWHKNHQSSVSSFVEEYFSFISLNSKFLGGVIKNSGQLYGTVEHSHTQFLPNTDVVEYDVGKALKVDLTSLKPSHKGNEKVNVLSFDIPESKFKQNMLNRKAINPDFRIRADRFLPKQAKEYCLHVNLFSLITQEQEKLTKEIGTVVPFQSNYGSPVYVSMASQVILDAAINTRKCGKQEDVPFLSVYNNETVKVVGSFRQNKSHVPSNHYQRSPFSKAIEKFIPIEKEPCCYDVSKIPEEHLEQIVTNNYGEKCQRSTLSLSWAHRNFGDIHALRQVGEEFYTKIATHYSNLRLLTDDEVLAGASEAKWKPYLGGMELDTSIGFTMKELYYVTKKSDVIGLTELGKYYWKDNDASDYIQREYSRAKEVSSKGEKFLNVFTELLKMEKLKIEKKFRGRTFVAEDLLGVMMERRILGMMNARAYKCDPECGIGTDPDKDFNRMFVRLSKFKNLFAIDYKNYDRSIPAKVMYAVRDLLMKANPTIALDIKSMMNTLIERLQVTGNTLAEVLGGLPSGCFSTAALNSILNDYIMFYAFSVLCEEVDIPWNWKIYNDNVVRYFYGDDGILSVSDDFKDVFNRSSIARVVKEHLGMTMDSSHKDGSVDGFDTFENASWISRFFRQLGRYPVQVGALKKISIGANFHYVSSTSLEHLGSLMEKAQYEAAKWEPEYFELIQKAIQCAIEQQPKLAKFVNLRMQTSIHDDVFIAGSPHMVVRQKNQIVEPVPKATTFDWSEDVEREESERQAAILEKIKITPNDKREVYCKRYLFNAQYFKNIISCKTERFSLRGFKMSYVSKLNEMYQSGKCRKPAYAFMQPVDQGNWYCTVTCGKISEPEIEVMGWDKSKHLAKEDAAYEMIRLLNPATPELKLRTQRKVLEKMEKQMNVSAGNQVPSTMILNKDISVTPDSGLFTNTTAATLGKNFNSTACALDNPAGSGAPFSKHQSCYSIYQRWTEKNVTISPALSQGTEIVRLSLDPTTWPKRLQEYVAFHDSLIPELDIIVAIAGASGSIGWITQGWVADASPDKKYSLDDLQQVSCETSNLNGTQIFNIHLTDIRRMGLFRKRVDDTEPYPGYIFMVDHPVTNVQRNDTVNYPVRVQAKLSPGCILMEPFGSSLSPPSTKSFDLGSYMLTNQLDLIVGSSATTSNFEQTTSFSDNGFRTGRFVPYLSSSNVKAWAYTAVDDQYILCATPDSTPSATFMTQLGELSSEPGKQKLKGCIPTEIYFAFGNVSIPEDFNTIKGTVYTIPKQTFSVGAFSFICERLMVQNTGCFMVANLDYSISTKYFILQNSKTNISSDDLKFLGYKNFVSRHVDIIYQDKNHNNDLIGNSFALPYADDTNEPDFTLERLQMKEPTTYVQTGNSIPSSNLATGLKQLVFTRQGTTTTILTDDPFSNLDNPVIPNVERALDNILTELGWKALSGDLYIDDVNIGQVGYQNGIFIVRTDDYKKMRAGISNNIFLKNLNELVTIQGISVFNTSGMTDWGSSSEKMKARRLVLDNCRKQAMIGAGAIQGLGSGLNSYLQQQFSSQMLDKVLANNRGIADANNLALEQRARNAFQRSLELKGYGSASMQHGQAGPRERNQFDPTSYGRFVSGGTLNPNESTQQSELEEHEVTITPKRNVQYAKKVSNNVEIPRFATPVKIGGNETVSHLNPEAQDFIPANIGGNKTASNLNPEAQDFVPTSAKEALQASEVNHK